MIDPKYLNKNGAIKHNAPQGVKLQYFIETATKTHKGQYDYSKQVYIKAIEKLEIICQKHGSFWQSPNNHISKKQGCPLCSHPSSRKTTQQFIQEAEQLGYGYDYSIVKYIDKDTKVDIICQEHGIFSMRPDAHTSQGQGCPKCQGKNFTMVYLLKCIDTGLTKIGITNNLYKRLSTIGGNLTTLAAFKISDPQGTERKLHKQYSLYRRNNSNVQSGNTEFFDLSKEQIQDIKEELFKEILCQ